MLGRAMARELERRAVSFEATDRELDIAEAAAVNRFAAARRFTHIVNCAAYTQVDKAESETEAAFAVNAEGAANLGRAARATGASLVHLSTDYVFDGRARQPYGEDARPAPLGVYGRSKLAGERRVLETIEAAEQGGRRVYVLRSSWLFGEAGASFTVKVLERVARFSRPQVVADQHGRPTYAADLARAALDLAGLSADGARQPASSGVVHFANRGITTWYDLAQRVLERARALGFAVKAEAIEPMPMAEAGQVALRPAYSALDTARFEAAVGEAPRPWQAALDEHLQRLLAARQG